MLISTLHNGTAMPMCGIIAAGGVLGLAVNLLSLADEPIAVGGDSVAEM